jgi:RimJ/RimL family protein N-acetyltransferase
MRFQRYGITLERLRWSHLDAVRRWRNDDRVRSRMRIQDIITPESHLSWFRSLHQRNDWYFLARAGNDVLGVFDIRNIDWESRSGEAGAFVSTPEFIGSPDCALAILALMDFGFFILRLETLEAKYHPSFREVEALNVKLGYEVCGVDGDGFVKAKVTASRYLASMGSLRLHAGRRRVIEPVPAGEGL